MTMATKIPGYHGQLLEVDLTARTSKVVDLDPGLARNYLGGRAMGGRMLIDALGTNWAKIDPFSPDAPLIFLTGPFVNFIGCKTNVVFKSPQSFGIVGSQGSGDFIHELRFCGYDGLILKGKASSPVYLTVFDDKVEFHDASKMWGKEISESHKQIAEAHGNETSQYYIGPAGENLVRFAAVITEWYRAAGRGGGGAVMGSKNLKAVVVKGTGPAPEVHDQNRLLELMDSARAVPLLRPNFHEWGTTDGVYTTGNRSGAEPVLNWQSEWHDHYDLGARYFAAEQWVRRYWADFGCTVGCSKLGRIKYGKRAGTVTELPDYEGGALLGTNFGLFSIVEIAYACSRPDELGFDLISVGNVCGFACEALQKGIITKQDIGGIDLKWGDADAFVKLMELIARREGEIPRLLGEGLGPASKKLGRGAEGMVMVTKNIEWGAHGARSGRDATVIAQSVGAQGGDHMSRAVATGEVPLWIDSNGMCAFQQLSMDQGLELLEAITGFGITTQELNATLIPRWTTMTRVSLLASGWTFQDDVNPQRCYVPLPDGPDKGRCVDKGVEHEAKQAYYEAMGWDKQGVPTTATLGACNLQAFDAVMAPLRARA
jgi:aldehyde:ferredoxin oxidoreductase